MSLNPTKEIYQKLVLKLEERSRLAGVMGVMHWDQEVIMPRGSVEARAKQMSALAGVLHEKSTDPNLGNLINKLINIGVDEFTNIEWCNIVEAKRAYDLEKNIPVILIQELAELSSRGHQVWAKAKEENRFIDFISILERLLELRIKWAEYAFPILNPYDANIDVYERGMTSDRLTPLFDKLKSQLIPLIKSIKNSNTKPDAYFLEGKFPIKNQQLLAENISRDMGFDFNKGRIDASVHPFCGGGHPTDVRITTRYRSNNFIESLFAVIHESGHGLYEQGRMPGFLDLPVSEPLTMGIHESQSLFWERMIGQSRNFCVRYYDKFVEIFPRAFSGVSVDNLYNAINICQPSFIRVEADEVTYPIHIIIRYEIEKGLFDGSIKVQNLPEVWSDKMEEYLEIRPSNDSQGVLQDVHWSGGAFGYFPSYTLGAIYACQFYNKMLIDLKDSNDLIEKGDLITIKTWLNKNIHKQGRLFSADELAEKVTGQSLNPDIFISYLKNKYNNIYGLN